MNTGSAFHSKNLQIKNIVKYIKKNTREIHINSKGSTNILEFFDIKK